MNKTTMTFAMVIALAAVFAITSPVDVAVAQTSGAVPDGDGGYDDGEHKEEKSCASKERKVPSQEQSS